jgi:hypothetical protein
MQREEHHEIRLAAAFLCAFAANGSDAFVLEKPDPAAAGMDASPAGQNSRPDEGIRGQGTAAGFVTLVARHGHLASLEAVGYRTAKPKYRCAPIGSSASPP